MSNPSASDKLPLAGAERAFRAASIFLGEGGEFRLSVAIFGHPVRRAHWTEQLVGKLAKEQVHLTECRIPETGEPRLLEVLTAHLREVPTLPNHSRAVIVTGISRHLPDAATAHDYQGPTPPFLAAANLDRELFPKRCPHPLLLCVTPTAYGQFRRHAPDLMHWCSHMFDFTEPALPDGSYPIRGISELEQSQPGTIYANRDELLRAAGIFRQGLDAAIAAHGPEHRETVGVRANLANVLDQLGRSREALELAEENLRVLEKAKDVPETEIAQRISQLAIFLDTQGRLAEAEPLMRRALALDEAGFGSDHPTIAIRLNNLAMLLQTTNRMVEAEPLMRRALAITEDSLGPDHPNVATTLNNLAQLLQATNRMPEAEPLMRRALAIDEASFGPEHPNVAIRLNNLARLLQATKRLVEAEPLMRRHLEIFVNFTRAMGHPHRHLEVAIKNHKNLLTAMGDTPAQAQAKVDQILGDVRVS